MTRVRAETGVVHSDEALSSSRRVASESLTSLSIRLKLAFLLRWLIRQRIRDCCVPEPHEEPVRRQSKTPSIEESVF